MMHSYALPYVCILHVMHLHAFRCMQMRCILTHSNYDAFMCINSYSSSRRRMNDLEHAPRTAMIAWYMLHDAWECVRMHTRVSMHASWSWASPLGGLHSPWMRVWVNASECAWMRKNASASECNVRQNAPYVWMHTNAFKCNSCRMQRSVNALKCVRMRVRQNATCPQNAPYVWMHTNAFKCNWSRMQRIVNARECVRMQVRQNATCRQNAPYVWRHINAFKCNSCRMQRIVNAQ